jgi:hypothetical protein
MIRELAWRLVARIVTIPAVTDWLIELERARIKQLRGERVKERA